MAQHAARVLVVEDQEIWRTESFSEPLQELGLEVWGAATKEEALDMIQQYLFDLAIIDLNLTEVPGNTDGLAVVGHILEKTPRIPIIIVSGSEDGLRALEKCKYPIYDTIEKHLFNLEDFVMQVNQALQQNLDV